jgi:hypothetical protein
MRVHGIVGLYRRRRNQGCTRRDPNATPFADLVNRRFAVSGPDRLWCGDVTEHPTAEGKVYLCAVLDAWSRRVVGWSIADHLRAELVVDALDMARWRRRPPEAQTIMHTDHGCQGGFTWSSQHLEREGLRWEQASVIGRCVQGAGRCVHLVDRRAGGVSISSGSGKRSLAVCRARRLQQRPAWHPRLGPVGSGRVAGCRHTRSLRCRAATCPSRSAKRSRSCALRVAACA